MIEKIKEYRTYMNTDFEKTCDNGPKNKTY